MKNKFIVIFLSAILCFCLSSCSKVNNSNPLSKDGFALDTVINIKIYDKTDDKIINGAFDLINDLENKLGAHKKNQDIYKINHKEINTVNKDALECINKSLYYSKLTNGAFDISIGSASLLWDFSSHSNPLPNSDKIQSALQYINYKNINLNGNAINLKEGTELDLGAIAKGYVADKVKEYLKNNGVQSAIINLGGNVLTIGNKLGKDFTIGIQDPKRERNAIVDKVKISDKSVVTSGVYERYIESNGKKYPHILNPKTGYPVDNNILQTTIISDLSIDGDALSTSIFLLGEKDGINLINSLDNVECCIYLKDGSKIKSSGFDKYLSN